jgi:dihydrofolate reductase
MHHVPAKVVDGFTYVTDGINSALKQAQAAAGNKDIWIAGGANVVQEFLKAGLIDELQISLAPVLFGTGTRLFDHIGMNHIELQNTLNIQTPQATHLRFKILK